MNDYISDIDSNCDDHLSTGQEPFAPAPVPETPLAQAREINRLTKNTLAVVLAGGRGSRLGVLTDWRTKPAVPFGGKFRIIDFTLSNCLNSNIRKICVLTQYKSHSLIKHLLAGWSSFRSNHGDFLDIVPAQQWVDEGTWFKGTADAVYQSLDIVESHRPEYVLILAGDHIYNMDYGEILASHAASGAAFTIACIPVDKKEASQFGVMQINEKGRIIAFAEKPEQPTTIPGQPNTALASMGIYVFSFDYLKDKLKHDAANPTSSKDFGKDIIPNALNNGDHIHAYQFRRSAQGEANKGTPHYWRDVGTIDAYYKANLELLSAAPPLDIYSRSWPVLTYQPQMPPAEFIGHKGQCCVVDDTLISGGCVVKCSDVKSSLLFSNVKVAEYCKLEGVVALFGCRIGRGSRLKNVLLDNKCIIPPETVIGEDHAEDAKRFFITEGGVVVVNRAMLGQHTGYNPGFADAAE